MSIAIDKIVLKRHRTFLKQKKASKKRLFNGQDEKN